MDWDLSDLYISPKDPQIEADKKTIIEKVTSFQNKYKEKINDSITAKVFLKSIKEFEEILEMLHIYLSYFSYRKYQDNLNEQIAIDQQKAEEFYNELMSKLIFYELNVTTLGEDTINLLLLDDEIKKYNNYLTHLRHFKNNTLTEAEEIIIKKKNQTGRDAFIRLYDEIFSGLSFPLKVKGKITNLKYEQIATILTSDPIRERRIEASKSISDVLSRNSKSFTYIQNTLLNDKKISDDIRSYSNAWDETLKSYQINSSVVDALTSTVSRNYSVVSRFYQHKKELLRLDELTEVDRYTSINNLADEKTYSLDEAKNIILNAFNKFSPEFGSIAKLFFDNNWIDSKIKPGKVSGAFCSFCVPSKHPFILLNYNGKLRDIMTLAHELGHGIHAYLSRHQPFLMYGASIAVAEIASVFCEALVFENLLNLSSDKSVKQNLLNNKIQDFIATIFRQNAFYIFEKRIHEYRRLHGEIPSNEINNIFIEEAQSMFGNSLKLSKGHEFWWIPVKHFFHYNFYVFTYVFGELLSFSLLGKYKNENQTFVKSYIDILSSGESKSPKELLMQLNLDIGNEDFWQIGISQLEKYINEYIKM